MRYILVDCFDTIFHRKDSNESTLYDWAREIANFTDNKISSFDFYKARKEAEQKLRNILGKEPTYKDIIKKVYEIYKLELGNISFHDFLNLCYDIDITVEKNQLYLDEKNVEKIKKYKKNGNRLVLVSDFYMPKNFFLDIFDYFGLSDLIDDFFISSEIGLRKSTGELYKFIIDYYNINPLELIMIGDNESSDKKMAEKYNIKSIYVPYNNSTITYENKRCLMKYIHQTLGIKKKEEIFKGFGAATILFCNRLYKSAVLMGCKKLLFCSREGQLLKQIFDMYQEEFCIQNKIATEYFLVSRRATLLPSLKSIPEEKFDRIFRQYRELTLNDFLFSIGFSNEEISNITNEENRFTRIYNLSESQFLREFLNSESFVELYEKKRIYQKEALLRYIKEINGNLDSLFIVDIGWKGTIQDNLYEMLEGKSKIQGFYFGLYGYKSTDRNTKKGLMFDLEHFKNENALFANNHLKLESVFVANHGSVEFYKCDNEYTKVFLSKDDKLELFNAVEPYQKCMVEGIHKVMCAIKNSPYSVDDFDKLLSKEYLYFLCTKLPRYRIVFEKIKSITLENFGNISKIKEKIPQVNGNIHRKQNRNYMYVYAAYNILDKLHMKVLYPIAWLYCRMVYFIKLYLIFRK